MNAPVALVLAALAVLLALLSSAVSVFAVRAPRIVRLLAMPLFGLAGLAALAAGLGALFQDGVATATLPLGLPWLPSRVRLDALSGFFLGVIGVVSVAVGLYGPAYVRGFERGRDSLTALGGFAGLFLAGMLLVVLADDAFLFMVSWEVMSLSSYFLVAFQHENAANRRAAFLYLLMAHIGGLAILLGYGVLASFGGGFAFEAMRAAPLTSGWASVAFVLAFIGFGMKAGLVPLHAWLPEAHPAAPSHISALMSGVMLKVAVYGFIRFVFDLLGDVQWQWGVAVLVIGGVSALTGVLAALVQTDLKRLLAYSSVENLGIIFIGLGLALVFLGTGHAPLGTLAFVAALYHVLNHALFKGLLFLGAGAILHSTHERDLEQMGGLLRRMPWTGLFFLLGCISIAALPPFNGFVSEWLTFQAALQAWQLESGVLRSLIPIVSAVLALTGALVAATFVKVYGVAFLGQARSRHVRRARQVPFGMRAGQGWLALLCLLFGVLPTAVTRCDQRHSPTTPRRRTAAGRRPRLALADAGLARDGELQRAAGGRAARPAGSNGAVEPCAAARCAGCAAAMPGTAASRRPRRACNTPPRLSPSRSGRCSHCCSTSRSRSGGARTARCATSSVSVIAPGVSSTHR